MPDLETRFRSLARMPTPDLWDEIVDREPRTLTARSRRSRVLAAAVALAVALFGFAGAAVVLSRLERGAEPPPAVEGVGNGVIAYVLDGRLWTVAPDGSSPRRLPIDVPGPIDAVAWAPDGRRLVLEVSYDGEGAPEGGYQDIFVANADGSDAEQLTDDRGSRLPAWSPDGSRIAYTYQADGRSEIRVMSADGSDQRRLTRDKGFDLRPSWSPDGTRIAFERVLEANGDIYVMNADGSGVERVIGNAETDAAPVWSPDGTRIAFTSEHAPTGVYVAAADGAGQRLRLADDDVENLGIAWSPDGRFLVVSSSRGPGLARGLYALDVASGHLTQLTDRGAVWSPAWQPVVTPDQSPAPTTASIGVRVTTTEGVADFPSAIAAGAGGIWVTSCCGGGSGDGEAIRLDPRTGEIVARVAVRAAPGWDFGGAGLAVGDGSVWTMGVTRGTDGCCVALVTRIDPATDTVADEIEVPDIGEGDLWVDGDDIYVLGFTDGGPSNLALAKVRAEDGSVEWRAPVPGRWSQTVFVSGGSVWVLGTAPDDRGPIDVTTLYRVDPGSGELMDEVRLGDSIYIPAVAPDVLWYRTDGGAQRFDPISATSVGPPVRPGPGCCTGPFVADGSGGVWVISSAGANPPRSIWHIDRDGNVVAVGTVEDRATFQQMQGQSYAFDPATETIWVQHYEDSVARVEIDAGAD
jgi:Tol biopolymer transport system component